MSGISTPRPGSSVATPMSWKLSSVNRQPVWHVAQRASSLNRANPRLASRRGRDRSPAIHGSNGAVVETTVRSKAAIALATVSGSIGSPG